MPKKERINEYERIGAKADRGEFTLVEPLDYLILDFLNPEGEMFAGLYPMAHTAKQVNNNALGGKMEMLIVGNRMLSLRKQGLVVIVKVPGAHGQTSYQRTERGTKLVASWKAKQPEPGDVS